MGDAGGAPARLPTARKNRPNKTALKTAPRAAGNTRRVGFANTSVEREFGFMNAPVQFGNQAFAAGYPGHPANMEVATAAGGREYPVDWAAVRGVLRGNLSGVATPEEKKALATRPNDFASIMPPTVSSARLGGKGFYEPVAGYPDYSIRAENARKVLAGAEFQQTPEEKAETRRALLMGTNARPKRVQPAANRQINRQMVARFQSDPKLGQGLAKYLETKHAAYAEHAAQLGRQDEIIAKIIAEQAAAAGGNAGGAAGKAGGRRRRSTRRSRRKGSRRRRN